MDFISQTWYDLWVSTVSFLLHPATRDYQDGLRHGVTCYLGTVERGEDVLKLKLGVVGYTPQKLQSLYGAYIDSDELLKARLAVQQRIKNKDFANIGMAFSRTKKKRSTSGPCLLSMVVQIYPDRPPTIHVFSRAWEASRRMYADFIFIHDIVTNKLGIPKFSVCLHGSWVYLSAKFAPIISILPEFKELWGMFPHDPLYVRAEAIRMKYYEGNTPSKFGAEKGLIKFYKQNRGGVKNAHL